jgi:hypothetical protein
MDQVLEKPQTATLTVSDLALKVSSNTQKEIGAVVDRLIADRKHWEANEFSSSNQRKYQILQSCHILYKSMAGVTGEKLALKRAFNHYCKEHGYNFKDSTHLMVKVVTCVFGNENRRRVSSYAKALRVAIEKGIGSMDIPKFLSDSGGVEEIRRESKSPKSNSKEKAQIGLTLMDSKSLGSAQSDALNASFDEAAYNGAVLLMSTREVDGSFQIKYVLQNGVLITGALAHLPTLLKEKEDLKAEEQKAANDEQARSEAVNQAVAA